jgi:hypothetical protein
MLALEICGHSVDGRLAYEVRTRNGALCGAICPRQTAGYLSSGIKPRALPGYAVSVSKRVFDTVEDAVAFVVARRIRKGWSV